VIEDSGALAEHGGLPVLGMSDDEIAAILAEQPDDMTPPNVAAPTSVHASPAPTAPAAPPAHVRMVQLFYDEVTHPVFCDITERLAERLGTHTQTDTVLAALRLLARNEGLEGYQP
jgi:hypothetical protein